MWRVWTYFDISLTVTSYEVIKPIKKLLVNQLIYSITARTSVHCTITLPAGRASSSS